MKARSNARKKPSSSSQGRDNIRVFPCPPLRPRRSSPDRQRLPCLAFGPFTFDAQTRLLSRDGREIALPPRVLGVLELLLHRAGDVVSRQELIDTVWKDAFVTDTSLAEAVSVLRQALGDEPQSPTYIQTLHRRGYRFVAPVSTAGMQAAARRGTSRGAGHRTTRLPFHCGPALPWSARGHLCTAGARRGLGTDARSTAASPHRGAVHHHAGAGDGVRRRPPHSPSPPTARAGVVGLRYRPAGRRSSRSDRCGRTSAGGGSIRSRAG